MAEFLRKTNENLKNECANCFYLRGYIALWCTDTQSIVKYGTNIRGSRTVRGCDNFKPQRTVAEALVQDWGYIEKKNAGFWRKFFRYNIVEYTDLSYNQEFIILD